jgi:hypothetical protein
MSALPLTHSLTAPRPIHRPFFLAAIAVILSAGASWGVYLLWQIGIAGSFTAVTVHHVNAHGHAQIFGWVGLFIMGFAYQMFPRFFNHPLRAPRLAPLVLFAMLIGITLRVVGMTNPAQRWALSLALAGASLEIAAIAIFTSQIFATFRKSAAHLEPYAAFLLTALLWFVAQSLASTWHTYTTMSATTRDELLWYIATYQAPLRDLQIHGLAMFMILGVSLRTFPCLFRLPTIAPRRAWTAWFLLTLAVLGETSIFVTYRFTENHAVAALLLLPWLLLALGVALLIWPWKFWRPLPPLAPDQPDRAAKFIRAAYAWLALSLIMLLLLPVYQLLSHIPFSHAYYGAIRHAVTVGFISLMILGMSSKVLPRLQNLPAQHLPSLLGPFILVNLGCLLRVTTQTLTDFHPLFFSVVGFSGILEVLGLAWWAAHLLALMLRPAANHAPACPQHAASSL